LFIYLISRLLFFGLVQLLVALFDMCTFHASHLKFIYVV
jgi:hypothetical protein